MRADEGRADRASGPSRAGPADVRCQPRAALGRSGSTCRGSRPRSRPWTWRRTHASAPRAFPKARGLAGRPGRRRRVELADAADERMAALPPSGRREACSAIFRVAFDEIGEMTAFLEQMPPRRAVRRLELAQEDLGRLAESCRRWASGPVVDPPSHPIRRPPDRGHRARRGRRQVEPIAEEAAEVSDRRRAEDRETARALRRQTRRVERLARRVPPRVAGEAVGSPPGGAARPPLLAILENTGAGPDPGAHRAHRRRVSARAIRGRSRPPSTGSSPGPTWPICSVFLLELGLKLCLAPDRLAYFLHHLVIDLIPSLPFGFVAHEIDLTEMGTAAASESGTLDVLAELRTDGPGAPVRPAGPADRPTDTGGADPPEAERSPGPPHGRPAQSQHHPVRALDGAEARIERPPSTAGDPERAGARPGRRSRAELDREQRRELAARILSDFDCQIERAARPGDRGDSVRTRNNARSRSRRWSSG